METSNKKTMKEYREMLILKGMGSELEKMAYPKISNLNAMLETIGYVIIPLRSPDPIKSENQA
jgi:hypothetical protein